MIKMKYLITSLLIVFTFSICSAQKVRVKANNNVFKTNKRPVVKTNKRPIVKTNKRPIVKTNKRPIVKTNKRPNKPRVTSTAVNLNRNINHVVVKKPRRPVYIKRPTLKRPGFFWIAGAWTWNGFNYVWVDGYWERERSDWYWSEGYWEITPNGFYWVDGYWYQI